MGLLSIDGSRWANEIVEKALVEPGAAPFRRWRLAARSLLNIHEDRRNTEIVEMAVEKMKDVINSDISSGNVWEWTCTNYDSNETQSDFDASELIAVRGGSWNNDLNNARCVSRNDSRPNDREISVGFRCSRTKQP